MKLESGNILRSVSSGGMRFTGHCGIVMVEDNGTVWVLHNTPEAGHPIMQLYDEYAAHRPTMAVLPYTASNERIMQYYEANKDKRFSLFGFNCERFAYGLYGIKNSPTVQKRLLEISVFVLIYLLLKK